METPYCVPRLHSKRHGLARQGLDTDLHVATYTEVQRRPPLDVVARRGAAVLGLLAREDQALLIRRGVLVVLDILLHVLDRGQSLFLPPPHLPQIGSSHRLQLPP